MSNSSPESNLPAQKFDFRAPAKAAPDPDDVHAAWLAGCDYGFAKGVRWAQLDAEEARTHVALVQHIRDVERRAGRRHRRLEEDGVA